ncbi:MAG: histidine kinase [Microbacterium sp. SCN 70-200]|uniref:sensor histidine kinase n=1 Tax=unclassified Microbacterium TaxID=2609290 RepID=UPI00086D1B7B|nr:MULTISPECIES: histidine kinase [unclassified Microbacterium]MBN9215616.1 sensor domain-containing protein [Microbacterium sp.]ODT41236.1 MAG: histidine kinase [Microbacterium sp. SCN 70-200]OJV79368.1 MAG: sensor histidine kinase [Microbacterium sp. 70-16]
MTTAVLPDSPAPARASGAVRFARHLGALAQLAAVGVIGSAIFGVLVTFLSLGVSLLLVIGIGALFLIAFVYLMWATAWLEYERVEGLYAYGLPALRLRRSGRPGFGGWLRTLWQQFIDGPMWRGIASASIATILGLVTLSLVGTLVSSLVLPFAPLLGGDTVRIPTTGIFVSSDWAILVGILGIVVSIALLVGIVLLHAMLTRAILVPSRESVLLEQARTAGTQRASAVRAGEVERTRIERDLHDGVQPRLVSVGMTLGLAQQKIDSDPTAAKALIDEAHTSTKAAITELRQLARGIHASVLDDRGLDAALSALAARSHVPVQLDVRLPDASAGRCSRTAEAAAYFAIAESLTNAAKHSRASETRVTVRLREDESVGGRPTLWARVEDNGIGGARILPGGGLDGITNRITAAGGTSRLDSPAGGPTALEVSIPCAS